MIKGHLAVVQQLSSSEEKSVSQVRRQWRGMCVLGGKGGTFQIRTEWVTEEAWFPGPGL